MTTQAARVAFLLDATSSMMTVKSQTISAFNEYINTLKQGVDYLFSLVTFNTIETKVVYKHVPIGDVEPLTDASYQPIGSTPLIDAAMKLIRAVEEAVQPNERVVFVIQTDGEENSSTEFKLADLQAAIKAKSDAGWQFVFIGAGLDAYAAAQMYGVKQGSTMSYSMDAASTKSAFRSLAANTQAYASGEQATMDWNEQQLADAGDQFRKSIDGSPMPGAAQPESKSQARRHEAAEKAKSLVDDIKL